MRGHPPGWLQASKAMPTYLSKEMFLVSSCVVTTGAVSRLSTCSSVGWAAASNSSRSCPARARVSVYTTRRSWSISITTALASASHRIAQRVRGHVGCPQPPHPALPPTCLTLAPEDEAAVPSLPRHVVKAQECGVYTKVLSTLPHFVGVTGADLGHQGH